MLEVAINNNRQNPVKPWNLHANDMIQLELQDKLREDLGLYYERQEQAFSNLTPEDLEEMEIQEGKALELLKLAQTFLASDGELDRMSRPAGSLRGREGSTTKSSAPKGSRPTPGRSSFATRSISA